MLWRDDSAGALLTVTAYRPFVVFLTVSTDLADEVLAFRIDKEAVLPIVLDPIDIFDFPISVLGTPPGVVLRFARNGKVENAAPARTNILDFS